MSDTLESQWLFSTIGDELHLINGFGFKPYQWKDSGTPIVRIQNLNNHEATFDYVQHKVDERFLVNTGDLLFAWSGSRGTSFGPFIWNRGDAVLNQHIFNVRLNKSSADKRFTYWWLKFLVGEIEQQAHGSAGLVHITRKELEKFRFPQLNPPVQRKIARILTTVDNLIEKTESLIAKYQAVKQGMMHDLFTRGVDAHGKLRPPQSEAPELYKQSELGWIPKEWESCRVDEVGSIKLGRQRSPKHQSGRFTTPYLRVANVFDGFIDYSDILQMDFTPTEKETYSLIQGDVLLNEGQSLELVGRSAIYEGEPNRFCFQNTLIRFRSYPPNDPYFCRGIFKFFIDIGRFMTIARQTTSVAHLGADRLAKLEFPCPHPDEQVRIAAALRQQEKHCELERKYKNNLIQQKSGLMQDLLTGRVRVKVKESEEAVVHG